MGSRNLEPWDDRTLGFENRAYGQGRADDYYRAREFAWKEADRRREQRGRRLALLAAPGCQGWAVILAVSVVVSLVALAWIARHPAQTFALVVIAVGVAVVVRRRRRGPVLNEHPVAPHDPRHAVKLDPLAIALTGEARALHDGLDAGRARYYLDALTRGVIAAPSRAVDVGREVITAQLPGGRIAPEDVNLARFAQTLGVPPSRVRPGPRCDGMLVVEVLHIDPALVPVPSWPALATVTDWTAPMPLGVDELGEPVEVELAGRRVLIGGQSGSGKTRLIRMVALYAASDPAVRLHVLDCKGSPALTCLRERAAWFHAGPADAAVLAHLQGIRADMHTRYERMRSGADPLRDDGWVVLVVDEVQGLWRVKGAVECMEEIARMGREAGVGLVLGSQAPNSGSVPTLIADQADVRVALRLTASWAVGMILGDFTVDAASLPKGHGHMSDDGQLSRVATYHVEDVAAAEHLAVLPALPAGPLVLGGHATIVDGVSDVLTEVENSPAVGLLGDVLATVGDRGGVSWDELSVTLDMDRPELVKALGDVGVRSRSVTIAGRSVKGVRRSDLETALQAVT